MSLSLQDVLEARRRISGYAVHTPLLRCETLDDVLGCRVWLKPENLQKSGSFKIRGAANKVLSLTDEERKRGIICISEGNHARACATIGYLTGTHAVIVMPYDAPACKINGVRKMHGELLLGSRYGTERREMLAAQIQEHGYINVEPTNDEKIIAGAGTVGLEIAEDNPEINTVLVPTGGAGLLSGVALAVKSILPESKVIGVQAARNDGYTMSFHAGYRIDKPTVDSIADGLNCQHPGDITFACVQKYVDDMITVEEAVIQDAVRLVAEEAKLITEPSSCVGIAAILSGVYKPQKDENIAFVLSAGNWDIDQLGLIYQKNYPVIQD